MQFESALKRNFVINILKGFIPDLLLAGIISVAMNGGWLGFLAAFLAIELLPFPIWLFRSIFLWTLFHLSTKRSMADMLINNLRLNDFPRPRETEESAESYFDRLANDETQPMKIRFAAAHEYWSFEFLRTSGQLQQLLVVTLAYELAIQDYYKQTPAKVISA